MSSSLFLIKEAIHSVAMEHERDCNCLTCRAADGDDEAFGKVIMEVREHARSLSDNDQ